MSGILKRFDVTIKVDNSDWDNFFVWYTICRFGVERVWYDNFRSYGVTIKIIGSRDLSDIKLFVISFILSIEKIWLKLKINGFWEKSNSDINLRIRINPLIGELIKK